MILILGLTQQALNFIFSLFVANLYMEKYIINKIYSSYAIYSFFVAIIAGPIAHSIVISLKLKIKSDLYCDAIFRIFRMPSLVTLLLSCLCIVATQYFCDQDKKFEIFSNIFFIQSIVFQIYCNILIVKLLCGKKIVHSIVGTLVGLGFSIIFLLIKSFKIEFYDFALSILTGSLATFIILLIFTFENNRVKLEINFHEIANIVRFDKLVSGLLITFPLIFLPAAYTFIGSKFNNINVLYLTIPLSFASLITLLGSFSKYFEVMTNNVKAPIIGDYKNLKRATLVTIYSWLVVFFCFALGHNLFYNLVFTNYEIIGFGVISFSSVFISRLNILRIGEFGVSGGYKKLYLLPFLSLLTILPALLIAFYTTNLILYSLSYLMSIAVNEITLRVSNKFYS